MKGIVDYERTFFTINGRKEFIFSGEMHYSRIPKELWKDRILKAKRAHLNTISVYIFWNWHEPEEGIYIFKDNRDLEGFMNMCKNHGLYFIARVGPYACAEWDSGGHPNWLYVKNARLRSLDSVYMEYTRKWYDVILPIIKRNLINYGGPVILVQIENEYFWGNVPYLVKLYDMTREYIKEVPIITNENRFVRGTPIIDTLDDYPTPWDLRWVENKTLTLKSEQPDKPIIHEELEGGWFSTFGGPLPTNRGSFPAEWTEILVKTVFALGDNGINIYMFHGGTNPTYYTGKYITTTYDYEAAISEWGELRERYYTLKRFGMFIEGFKELVTSTSPITPRFKPTISNVEVFSRANDKGETILFLRNLGDKSVTLKLISETSTIPENSEITLKGKSMKMLLINYKIPFSPFKIEYTTAEPLYFLDYGKRKVIIAYDEDGVQSETKIVSDIKIDEVNSSGKVNEHTVIISAIHDSHDKLIKIRAGDYVLQLVLINKFRASRTWIVGDTTKTAIISDIYFLGDEKVSEDSILADIEIDDKSSGLITVLTDMKLRSLETLDDGVYKKDLKLTNVGKILTIPLDFQSSNNIDFNSEFKFLSEKKPLEQLGYLYNGYYEYIFEFETTYDLPNLQMLIGGYNDFAYAKLNGKFVGASYNLLEFDGNGLLKKGTNTLEIILEAIGHPNDGLVYVPNGILGDIYIGKEQEQVISDWKKIEYGKIVNITYKFDMTESISKPEAAISALSSPDIKSSAKSITGIHGSGLYFTTIVLRKDGFKILTIGDRERASYFRPILVFINGNYVGVYTSPMDITDYIKDGENEIAILIPYGEDLVIKISNYKTKLKGKCMVRKLIDGNDEKINFTINQKVNIKLPLVLNGDTGINVIEGRFKIDIIEKTVAPIGVKIEGKGIRGIVYLNGYMIGRFVPEGPQQVFYAPESTVKNGENIVTVLVVPTDKEAIINNISIVPYYIHSKDRINLS